MHRHPHCRLSVPEGPCCANREPNLGRVWRTRPLEPMQTSVGILVLLPLSGRGIVSLNLTIHVYRMGIQWTWEGYCHGDQSWLMRTGYRCRFFAPR